MTRKKHVNKIMPPTQSRDNPANFVYVYVFCLFLTRIVLSNLGGGGGATTVSKNT